MIRAKDLDNNIHEFDVQYDTNFKYIDNNHRILDMGDNGFIVDSHFPYDDYDVHFTYVTNEEAKTNLRNALGPNVDAAIKACLKKQKEG